ncbi:hypothetical protein [Kibdelosporangium aridum]|uniref:hypothetical protein n=1 Tax=Kibdelosporangium aridum TaxID=2030 RepID=UPI00068CFAF6
MNLDLRIVAPDPGSLVEVRPFVDGQDIIAQADPDFPGDDPKTLLGELVATDDAREVRLAEAVCTVGCCGALFVTIQRNGGEVVWNGWRNPDDPELELAEMRFDAAAYDAEVRRVTADHSWEWPARTVARLLDAELREHEDWFARWDCEFSGIGVYRADSIDLFFMHPRSAQHQLQFRIQFVLTDREPADQARGFAGLVSRSDPRSIGKVVGGTREAAAQLGYEWHGN